MRKPILLSLLTIVAIGAIAGGYYWLTVARFQYDTDDAYLQSDITVISPKISGYVTVVAVKDNQQVKPGDVLIKIDDTEYAAKVAQARATVEARRAAIANLDSRLVWQQSSIAQAQADIAGADAELRRASADKQRQQSLLRADVAAPSRVETAEADADKAQANVAKSRARYDAERAQLAVLQTERKQDQADLEQAQAELALAQNDLDNTVIKAPVAGVVGNRAAEAGLYVRPGTMLLSVVPLDQVWVEANFKETALRHMTPGQPVSVEIDAFPGIELTGTVDSLAPATGAKFSLLPPENATGNFTKIVQRVPVKITLPPDNVLAGRLRPGMSAVVSIDSRQAGQGAILSPALAQDRK
jgi:membrane fusion protein (multidrug efflux system)